MTPSKCTQEKSPANARLLKVELAGLEPATSWVRSGKPTPTGYLYLQGL